jgi:hypothetical protein
MRRARWLLAACLLAAAPAALAQTAARPWGLEPLMLSLSQVQSASANFTERRTSPLLSAPIITQGMLTYAAPDYMRKTTLSPVPESFTLNHSRVTMSGGPDGETREFLLAEVPQIGGLVEGVRATLAGDLPTLQRLYEVQLSGGAAGWQLLLRPKDPRLARFVQTIVVQGSQDRIAVIDTLSRDGSDSRMRISDIVNTQVSAPPAAQDYARPYDEHR